jgi:hypothetical protein
MMRLWASVAVAGVLMLLAGRAQAGPLEDYAAAAIGMFSTQAQHEADARYDEVEARIVRIWPERTDGLWLYQEQAVLTRVGMSREAARSAPYFQRIGHVRVREDGLLVRDNYPLVEAGRFVGLGAAGYAGPVPAPADLGPAGCANIIQPIAAGHFVARTENCANSYRGAVSMLSLAITTPDTYANWDRGFDGAGQRVWGPESGGYVFRRVP